MLVIFHYCTCVISCMWSQLNLVLEMQNYKLFLIFRIGEVWWLEQVNFNWALSQHIKKLPGMIDLDVNKLMVFLIFQSLNFLYWVGSFVEFVYKNSLIGRKNYNVVFVVQSLLDGRECCVQFLYLSSKRLWWKYERGKGRKVVNEILLFGSDHGQWVYHLFAIFRVRRE